MYSNIRTRLAFFEALGKVLGYIGIILEESGLMFQYSMVYYFVLCDVTSVFDSMFSYSNLDAISGSCLVLVVCWAMTNPIGTFET